MGGRKTRGLETAVASLLSQLQQAQFVAEQRRVDNERLRAALELATSDPAGQVEVIDTAVRRAVQAANKRHGRMSEKIRMLRMEVMLLRKDPGEHRETLEFMQQLVTRSRAQVARQAKLIDELRAKLRQYEKHTPDESEG